MQVFGGRSLGDSLFVCYLFASDSDVVVEVVVDLNPSHAPIIFIF